MAWGEKSWPSLGMTANQFQFQPAVDQCPSKSVRNTFVEKSPAPSGRNPRRYLATQLADEQWGPFFHPRHASVKSPENLRKYADKCYFAWGGFSALPSIFSLKQNAFPVWFAGLRGKFPDHNLERSRFLEVI